MDPRLLLVTQSGSVDALYSLIQKDPYILQNVDLLPFAHTPLHEASSTGNLDLAMELMILKPSFAKKLNTDGFSPLHLAVENNQVQLARELVNVDPDLIRVAGRKGMTPLHLVVKNGDVNLLIKFLLACPESIKDTNVNGETALHIAVINDREKELEELIGLIQRLHKSDAASIEFHVINRLDRDGNTALQLAKIKKNDKILKCMSLIRNIQYKGGVTALDNIDSNQGNFSSLEGGNSENSDSLKERTSREAMHSNCITNVEIPPLKPQPGRTAFVFLAKSPSRNVESLPLGPPKSLKVTSNKAYAPPPSMPSSASPPRPPPLPSSGGHKPPRPLGSFAPPMPSSAGPPRPPPPPSLGWPKSPPSPGALAPPMPSSVFPPRPPPPPGYARPKQPPSPPSSTVPKPPPPPSSTRPKKPPPPPSSSVPKPPPPPGPHGLKGLYPPPPTSLGLKAPRSSSGPSENNSLKTKLKPLFWDKVQANPDHSMVWNHIRSGSFQFNEELIESLFGYVATDKNKNEKNGSFEQAVLPQFAQILEPKKRQNLSILLRALNVRTEEVCDALREGKELPIEFIQILLKTAPTQEEELKLRSYSGEITQLGSAERFLKAVFDIPLAFKRLETLLFMCTLHEEMDFVKESFHTLEVACKELRGNRLFMKLLEAVLRTGNRMNDGTSRGGAQAFKLDTLLKLADVKGTDGKTTLLHFVVQEIIRSEGLRAVRIIRESQSFSSVKTEDLIAEETSVETEESYHNLGLQKVSGLSSELKHVKKAANIDADGLIGTVLNMGNALSKARDFVNSEMKSSGEESGFRQALKDFIQNVEGSIMSILEEETRIMALVRRTGDYFQGKGVKDEGLRLFLIVRDFLIILDKSCKKVREERGRLVKMARKQSSTTSSSFESLSNPPHN